LGTLGKVWQGVKNCVISLKTHIDSGLDVPHILQDLTREGSAGNDKGNLKQGQNRDKTVK
jgi:hypothetical protein